MDDAEKRRRAAEADRLLNEPLLKEAFDILEREAIEDMLKLGTLAIGPDDDRRRREAADRVNTIRIIRNRLHAIITDGMRSAQQPQKWA